jgi:hypothetical protein
MVRGNEFSQDYYNKKVEQFGHSVVNRTVSMYEHGNYTIIAINEFKWE